MGNFDYWSEPQGLAAQARDEEYAAPYFDEAMHSIMVDVAERCSETTTHWGTIGDGYFLFEGGQPQRFEI